MRNVRICLNVLGLVASLLSYSLTLSAGIVDEAGIVSLNDSGSSSSEVNSDSGLLDDSTSDRRECERFSGNPMMCRQQFGCFYDHRNNRCVSENGGGGHGGGGHGGGGHGGAICNRFNFDYMSCVNNGCRFDGMTGRCFFPWNPGFGNMVCNAVDMGWEEHLSGHLGYGRTQDEAYRNAMAICLANHGRCRVTLCRVQ